MKLKNLLPILTVLLFSTGVMATDGYTEVYEVDDMVEAAIDLGAAIIGGIAGEGATIGSTLGSVIVLSLLGILLLTVATLIGHAVGFVDITKIMKRKV